MSIFLRFMFPSPMFVKTMSFFLVASMAHGGISEARGVHMAYSKFWNANINESIHSNGGHKKRVERKISSRRGMLLAYMPALVAAAASFSFNFRENHELRSLLLSAALTIHFLKRTLEVLFIHVYSGSMMLHTVITISISYVVHVVSLIYSQSFTQGLPDPEWDLKFLGIVLFFVGIAGNFYHHCLLAKLRKNEDDGVGYKIPKGGLFGLVVCPHYLFEIIGFLGISFISQTLCSFCYACACMLYLMGRSHATKRWYLKKFQDFPSGVKALVPYVF